MHGQNHIKNEVCRSRMSWRHNNINNNVEIDYSKIVITLAQSFSFRYSRGIIELCVNAW